MELSARTLHLKLLVGRTHHLLSFMIAMQVQKRTNQDETEPRSPTGRSRSSGGCRDALTCLCETKVSV